MFLNFVIRAEEFQFKYDNSRASATPVGSDSTTVPEPETVPYDVPVLWSLWTAVARRLGQDLLMSATDPGPRALPKQEMLLKIAESISDSMTELIKSYVDPTKPGLLQMGGPRGVAHLGKWFWYQFNVQTSGIRAVVLLLQRTEYLGLSLTKEPWNNSKRDARTPTQKRAGVISNENAVLIWYGV